MSETTARPTQRCTTEKSATLCCVVQLNWCHWQASIESLESIFRLNTEGVRVVWCDNESPDGSVEKVARWASGMPPDGGDCSENIVDAPSATHAARVKFQVVEHRNGEYRPPIGPETRLIIVRTGANDGCAAGLNVGLRLALSLQPEFLWLLNIDARPDAEALNHLVRSASGRPDVGMWGSTILRADAPGIAELQGGARMNLLWCTATPCGEGLPMSKLLPAAEVERRMSYVYGASMFIPAAVVREIGLIPEHFFLYFEEISWAEAMKGRYTLGYCRESIVTHEGGVTRSGSAKFDRGGGLHDVEILGNRLVFTREYHRLYMPSVVLALCYELVLAALTGRWGRVSAMCQWSFWGKRSRLKTKGA